MRRVIVILAVVFGATGSIGAVRPMSTDTLRGLLTAAVKRQLPKGFRCEVEQVYVTQAVPDDARLTVLSPDVPVGHVNFQLQWDDRGRTRMGRGNATVRAFGKLAVSRQALRHGETISEQNVSFEEREVTAYLNSGYFMDLRQLKGKQALGYVRPGVVMGSTNTQTQKLVIAGQTIDLFHQRGALRIVGKMKALESGDIDQWIRVENPSSRKVFQARVAGPGEVRMR